MGCQSRGSEATHLRERERGGRERGGGGGEGELELENFRTGNSKTLILKDSSVRPIWTYLTVSPCYFTNTSKHDDITTNRERERERELKLENFRTGNSKTLILKNSSVRSIWTYLTVSPCYFTNTSKHDDITTNKERERERELELGNFQTRTRKL